MCAIWNLKRKFTAFHQLQVLKVSGVRYNILVFYSLNYKGYLAKRMVGPALIAEWSIVFPLTGHGLLPMSAFEHLLAHVRTSPVT